MTVMMATEDLADLGIRINEAHGLAIRHAGKAVGYAIACGELLLKAKAKVPHGQWLPWLRANVAFGERSAQGYMRVAQRLPNPQHVADWSLRRVLGELRTPLRREGINAELTAWIVKAETDAAARPDNPTEWSVEDAQTCIAHVWAFDEMMHRYGMCPWVGHPEPLCCVCDAELAAAERTLLTSKEDGR
jgi:hypothetical protein